MAFNTTDYKLTSFWTDTEGRKYYNVWYWEAATIAGTAEDLFNAFGDVVSPLLEQIIHTSASVLQMSVINLGDDTDFYEAAYPGFAGQVTGDPLPPFVSASFTIQRPSRAIRNGRKAFGPLGEVDFAGLAPTGTFLGKAQDISDAINPGIVATVAPLSGYRVAIPEYTRIDPDDPSKGYTITGIVQATGFQFNKVGHQVSR